MARAIATLIDPFPKRMRRTLTLDNGKEFASHRDIQDETGLDIYFADPYSAWQRGSIENANGLIRQYIPKGSDLTQLTPDALDQAIGKLNNRPRQCLGFKTPNEVMSQRLDGAIGS